MSYALRRLGPLCHMLQFLLNRVVHNLSVHSLYKLGTHTVEFGPFASLGNYPGDSVIISHFLYFRRED